MLAIMVDMPQAWGLILNYTSLHYLPLLKNNLPIPGEK